MINTFKKLSIFLILFILVSSSLAQIKLPDEILVTLNQQHPRLLVKSLHDFENIKNNIAGDAYMSQCQVNILYKANAILIEPVCSYEIPDGLRLLVMSRNVLSRVYILSMAYRLTGKNIYVERLWKDLLAASQFPDWNPRHFLDVAEMTHAFAIGYDWLFDTWTTQQKQVIKQAIIEKGLLRGMSYYNKWVPANSMSVDFPRSHSNWNSVCNAGMGIGALAIADEEPQLAEVILKNALASIPLALKAYAPDGGFREGSTYWGYAMKYNVMLMASLKTSLGTDFGLSDATGFSVTGNFPIAMNGATGLPFQYADAWPNIINPPLYFWLANRFNNPMYLNYIKERSEKSVLDLIWYSPKTANINLPLDNYFSNANVASLRSAWNDKNAWFVGIKGGHNQAPHAHLDLGSFIVEKNNIRWLSDLGVDSYDLNGYFDDKVQRWTYYRTRAEGHNTLVINPDSQPDQYIYAKAKITNFVSKKEKAFALIDLTDAYKDKVSSALRGISLIDRNQVLIQDEIKADKPFDLYWFAHTPAIVNISANGKKATMQIDNQKLVAEIISPAQASFIVMPATLLPTSLQSVGNDQNKGMQKLAIHLKNVTNTTIAVIIKEENNNTKQGLIPLSKW